MRKEQIFNQAYYWEDHKQQKGSFVSSKPLQTLQSQAWVFHHYSDPAATLHTMSQLVWHFVFADLRTHHRGCHFDMIDNIQNAVTDQLNSLTDECFQEWKECMCCFRMTLLLRELQLFVNMFTNKLFR